MTPEEQGGAAGPLRVVIAGGGTGGHLYPGIAVARQLMARDPRTVVTFAGTAAGLETRVVPREGLALDLIRSAGLKGKSLVALARGLALLLPSAVGAWRVLSRRRPHVVVGVGGYSSGPVVLLAALRGIPTLVLEQNAVPGFANRMLARVVDAAAVTYEETRSWFGNRAIVSGNPVRSGFFAPERPDDAGGTRGRRVLVFGGSQGAHAINVAMAEAAGTLAGREPRLALTHQTGERDVAMVREAYGRARLDARVEPYLDAMDREMAWADLIVCRAGASTLAEVAAAGRAAVLVPLPTATDDHQRKNADALVRLGAADVLPQAELTGGTLAARIDALLRDPERRATIAAAVRRVARPDAARVIADRIVALARGGRA
jgi:UDP-N-acetylglucosamine--N-acetylmuramyl-(pentapeptide) pyrophosphoryl-undecaprenol N-acetylglucosamine transferase